jgi:hypothetical protein
VLLCALAALLLAAPAHAGSIGVVLGLVPGKLTLRAPQTVVPADGLVAVSVRVADARGSGRGWTLRLQGGTDIRVVSITARCASGSTCTLPSPAAVASGATVLRAARNTGMGVIELVVELTAATRTTAAFAVSSS